MTPEPGDIWRTFALAIVLAGQATPWFGCKTREHTACVMRRTDEWAASSEESHHNLVRCAGKPTRGLKNTKKKCTFGSTGAIGRDASSRSSPRKNISGTKRNRAKACRVCIALPVTSCHSQTGGYAATHSKSMKNHDHLRAVAYPKSTQHK